MTKNNNKRFSFWISPEEIQEIKKRAELEKRSVSNYIKVKALADTENSPFQNKEMFFKKSE